MRMIPGIRLASSIIAALLVVGCSRTPRNELLVRYECEFKELDSPLPVAIDLGRLRMSIGLSSDTFISVPLNSIDGQLVFENAPRDDQSMKLWIRQDGSARLRTRFKPTERATEITGHCTKKPG